MAHFESVICAGVPSPSSVPIAETQNMVCMEMSASPRRQRGDRGVTVNEAGLILLWAPSHSEPI